MTNCVFTSEVEKQITRIITRMDFFTAQQLQGLQIGDVFKTEGLFQGVDPKATVKWEVVNILRGASKRANTRYIFEAFYYRISLGEFEAVVKKNGEVVFSERQ